MIFLNNFLIKSERRYEMEYSETLAYRTELNMSSRNPNFFNISMSFQVQFDLDNSVEFDWARYCRKVLELLGKLFYI